MERPFTLTRAIPKFHGVIVIFVKEFSEFTRNQWHMNLKWVWWWVKYSFCSMDGVSDDDDSPNIGQFVAWLMLHLIAKISASVDIIFIAWWTVLIICLSWTWICDIDVATWFLILASDTTIADFGSADAWRVILLRLQMCIFMLSSLCLFVEWKEKQLGKTSISLSPGENFLLNRSNNGKISLILLSISIIGPLMFKHCFGVSLSNDNWWVSYSFTCLDYRCDFKIWLDGREYALS